MYEVFSVDLAFVSDSCGSPFKPTISSNLVLTARSR